MVHEVQPIDLEAFRALDRRRLLCVLGRAIDEEAARYTSGEDSTEEGPGGRARLQTFCRLVGMIREMSESEPGSRESGSGRKGSRSL
jgi:hypothetical protein